MCVRDSQIRWTTALKNIADLANSAGKAPTEFTRYFHRLSINIEFLSASLLRLDLVWFVPLSLSFSESPDLDFFHVSEGG